jgi:hypothetical protein
MRCKKCGADNPETQRYCGECGTQLPGVPKIAVAETLETPKEELVRGTLFSGRYEIIEELGRDWAWNNNYFFFPLLCSYWSAALGVKSVIAFNHRLAARALPLIVKKLFYDSRKRA